MTQVVVDEMDPGFQHPTKPVGSFYTKEEAEKFAASAVAVRKTNNILHEIKAL